MRVGEWRRRQQWSVVRVHSHFPFLSWHLPAPELLAWPCGPPSHGRVWEGKFNMHWICSCLQMDAKNAISIHILPSFYLFSITISSLHFRRLSFFIPYPSRKPWAVTTRMSALPLSPPGTCQWHPASPIPVWLHLTAESWWTFQNVWSLLTSSSLLTRHSDLSNTAAQRPALWKPLSHLFYTELMIGNPQSEGGAEKPDTEKTARTEKAMNTHCSLRFHVSKTFLLFISKVGSSENTIVQIPNADSFLWTAMCLDLNNVKKRTL